ncbi:MAG TPA: LCP family protein, partial [Mobilitalea sp.]|nr:LCP family protein [Mobilitalea sp.]
KSSKKNKGKKKKKRILRYIGISSLLILAMLILAIGTKPGRSIIYKTASKFVYSNINKGEPLKEEKEDFKHEKKSGNVVWEDYVYNFLIFGVEEIGGAKNTDAMLIGSINKKDGKIKLTSLLRDSYVDIPGYKANKLNSAFSKGGVDLLIETIEKNYKIQIDGYAYVNFESFEKLVDMLGGVTIELGKEEAAYLNKTNYISKKENRNVKPGVNKLNGNQVMGYVRVRKVKTLGGANYDYGRVVRQQRVLKAMFDSLMSTKNLFKIIPIGKQALSYVTTDLSQKQIEILMEAVIENKITTLETSRIPVDGAFEAPKKYNGIGYPIILDWDKNLIEMYKFIFGYTEEEALAALERVK